MIYLDFYLKDNGRIEYTKDISLTQYSTKYIVRLLTKKTFDIVNMNITLPNQIKTYKKNLQLQSMKVDGHYAYTYQLGLDTTGFEIGAEKAQIKVGFFFYPDKTNQKDVLTSALCYLPILASTDDMPSDGSITNSELSNIQSSINEINLKLEHLNVGNIDTAQNYDTSRGNIKEKFDRIDAQVQNVETDVKEITQFIENLDLDGSSVGGSLKSLQNQVDALKETDIEFKENILNNKAEIDRNASNIAKNSADITDIKTNILPTLQAGVRYEIVNELPKTPVVGVIYLLRVVEPESENDRYIEYMYLNGAWEILGSTDLNLEDYLTKTDAEGIYIKKGEVYSKEEVKDLHDTLRTDLRADIETVEKKIPTGNKDLSNTAGYITAAALNPYAKKEDIPINVSQFVNDEGYITIVQTDAKYATKTLLTETKSELQANINKNSSDIAEINKDIISLSNDLSDVNETAETALAMAEASSFAKVFDSFELLYSYIRTKQTIDPNKPEQTVDPVKIGTLLFLKDPKLPDYWVSAIFDYPQDYTTQGGQLLEDVYYGVEELEELINLSEYYTKEEVHNEFVENTEYKAEIATKENHSNKVYEINSSSTDVQYPSAGAVYRDAEARKAAMEEYIGEYTYSKEKHNDDITAVNQTIQNAVLELRSADVGINERLSAHDDTLSNHETRITTNTGEITKLNTNLTALSNKHNTHEEAFEVYKGNNDQRSTEIEEDIAETNALLEKTISDLTEEATKRENKDLELETSIKAVDDKLTKHAADAEERYLDYSETISKAESVVDYGNNLKNLRFTTDTVESDFVISNKDLNEIQTMLTMIVPNEYN